MELKVKSEEKKRRKEWKVKANLKKYKFLSIHEFRSEIKNGLRFFQKQIQTVKQKHYKLTWRTSKSNIETSKFLFFRNWVSTWDKNLHPL